MTDIILTDANGQSQVYYNVEKIKLRDINGNDVYFVLSNDIGQPEDNVEIIATDSTHYFSRDNIERMSNIQITRDINSQEIFMNVDGTTYPLGFIGFETFNLVFSEEIIGDQLRIPFWVIKFRRSDSTQTIKFNLWDSYWTSENDGGNENGDNIITSDHLILVDNLNNYIGEVDYAVFIRNNNYGIWVSGVEYYPVDIRGINPYEISSLSYTSIINKKTNLPMIVTYIVAAGEVIKVTYNYNQDESIWNYEVEDYGDNSYNYFAQYVKLDDPNKLNQLFVRVYKQNGLYYVKAEDTIHQLETINEENQPTYISGSGYYSIEEDSYTLTVQIESDTYYEYAIFNSKLNSWITDISEKTSDDGFELLVDDKVPVYEALDTIKYNTSYQLFNNWKEGLVHICIDGNECTNENMGSGLENYSYYSTFREDLNSSVVVTTLERAWGTTIITYIVNSGEWICEGDVPSEDNTEFILGEEVIYDKNQGLSSFAEAWIRDSQLGLTIDGFEYYPVSIYGTGENGYDKIKFSSGLDAASNSYYIDTKVTVKGKTQTIRFYLRDTSFQVISTSGSSSTVPGSTNSLSVVDSNWETYNYTTRLLKTEEGYKVRITDADKKINYEFLTSIPKDIDSTMIGINVPTDGILDENNLTLLRYVLTINDQEIWVDFISETREFRETIK